jgi:OmcA/MtrC family decaheme c-type cytochrome
MASYMNRVSRIAALALLGLLLAACSGGDDGRDGDAGPGGPTGSPGPAGPSGGTAVPVDSADRINITVSSVGIPAGGGAPVIELSLSNDDGLGLKGLPAADIRFVLSQLTPGSAGGSSEWQSYVTRDTGGIANGQATTETATAGTFADNGDGTYQYTFAKALTAYAAGPAFDASKTHRLGVEIREQAPISTNGIYDFVPAGGAPVFERKIVDNDTCNACHDRLEFHGGPRTDVQYCVTCHNPYSIDGDSGNTVDMKALIHNIHAGRDGYVIFGYRGTEYDYSNIHWTQDLRNCQTCHEEDDANTPQASNWRLVQNRASCGTCHYDDGDPNNGQHDYAIEDGVHPFGQVYQDDTQCQDCHGPNSAIPSVQVANVHAIPEDLAAEAFEYQVVSIVDTGPGELPTATIRVLNPQDPDYANDPASTAYDINDPNGPFQASRARLRLDITWTTDELANLDPNDELGRPADSGAPFAPIDIDFTSDAANDGTNTFTKTADAGDIIPSTASGSGLAILEGRPRVDIDGSLTSLAVAADFLPFAITDTDANGDPDPQDRRKVVNIDKCNDCHKNLSLHGDNRSGNTEVCSACHNPNATDIAQRGVAGSDCQVELGDIEAPIDLKRMIHQIHSGNTGVCGYNNSAHSYFDVVYPGHLNNCEGCHVEDRDTFYPVDPAKVLATTVLTGDDRSILSDDVAISPNTSVCSSCHSDFLAAEHMKQNGGDFEAGKDETGALVSSEVETCELCHGPGRSADVKEMHGVDEFQFN